ncbi:MAG: hypothetical protein ABF296_04350 [Oceanococcaceae bacterium]
MVAIYDKAKADIEKVKGARYTMPVRRLDDVRAAGAWLIARALQQLPCGPVRLNRT